MLSINESVVVVKIILVKNKRNLVTRLYEHLTCEDSGTCKYFLNNPNNEINFDFPKHWTEVIKLRNYASKNRRNPHISKTESQSNVDNQSLPLYLFGA